MLAPDVNNPQRMNDLFTGAQKHKQEHHHAQVNHHHHHHHDTEPEEPIYPSDIEYSPFRSTLGSYVPNFANFYNKLQNGVSGYPGDYQGNPYIQPRYYW